MGQLPSDLRNLCLCYCSCMQFIIYVICPICSCKTYRLHRLWDEREWWLQNPLWPCQPTVQISVGKKASLLLTDEHANSLPTVVLVVGFGPTSHTIINNTQYCGVLAQHIYYYVLEQVAKCTPTIEKTVNLLTRMCFELVYK